MPHKQVSTIPSRSTFTVSLVRAKPASRNMKPACMKNTRKAVISTHIVLIGLTYAGGGASGAGVAAGAFVPVTAFVVVNAATFVPTAATAFVAASVGVCSA